MSALEAQVADRRERAALDAELHNQAAQAAIDWDQEIVRRQAEAAKARRDYNKAVASFRATQVRSATREWDLNDPAALRKDRPARDGDDDPRCGPASMQVFAGEDLMRGARLAAARKEMTSFWQAQKDDLEARAAEARAVEAANLAEIERQQAALAALVAKADAVRAAMTAEIAAKNAQLAADTAARRKHEDDLLALASQAEIDASLSSPWLSEHPGTTVNPDGTFRKDNYKGMSAEERKGISELQQLQVEAKRAAKEQEALAEMEEARRMVNLKRAMDEAEQRRRTFMATQQRSLKSFLDTQKAEKNEKDKTLRETYANKVTEDYFNQFGTSER